MKDRTRRNSALACASEPRKETFRIAEQLALYVSGSSFDQSALRRHVCMPTKSMARFTRANGDIVNCDVLDLSLSGISLATESPKESRLTNEEFANTVRRMQLNFGWSGYVASRAR